MLSCSCLQVVVHCIPKQKLTKNAVSLSLSKAITSTNSIGQGSLTNDINHL